MPPKQLQQCFPFLPIGFTDRAISFAPFSVLSILPNEQFKGMKDPISRLQYVLPTRRYSCSKLSKPKL
jgi:hypothetical protein